MVFTDAEGYQWIDSIEYTHLSYPWIDYYSIQPLNENCRKYDLTFNVYSICPPYEWVLYDENNVFLKKDTIYDSSTPPLIDSLSYNTYYNIVVTSLATNETTTTTYYRDQAATSLDYTIGQVNVACLPDTAKGYIDIFRNGYYPVLFGAGTRFEFIDGPTRPLHDTLVAVGDEYHLYPFSVDSTIAENVKLSEGLYRFKVTDTCGFVDTLRVDYKTYKVVDFRYEMQYDCNSALLIPSATVYLGNDALPYYYYYFRLLEAPPLTSYYSLESVYSGGTIQLTVPGHYKLQLSTIYQSPGSPDACSLDTIDFYYSPEISKVTFDKVDAYICDEGNGYIEFLVKGGIGNISYVLIGPGDEILKEEILPKGTPFTYDNAEKNVAYKVEFRDMNCSGAGGSEIITVSNLVQDRLIFGPGALCSGETINLYSDVPAESYLWTFPNGLGTSTLANPVIYNASAEHKGIYNLEITNVKGCLANFSRSIDIDVFNTVVPEADSMKYVCVGNSTEPVEATVSPGYKLIWYNEHKVEIPVAPSYSTTKADTFRYFVSQYETSLFCYSDTIPVTIIVEDLPAPVAAAFAGDICKNTPPLVLIPNADSSYVYRIYNSDNILVGVDTARSDTLKLQTTDNSFVAAGTLYLEVENNHGCVSSGKLDVPVKVVYPAPPVVYDTFYCLDAVAVPLRADSAKGNYLRWYDTDGATALPSSPTPPTDVAGTFTYWVAQADTLLGCEGDKVALEVVIIDLPDILIDAVAPEICRGISPSVTIGVTNDLYTYTVFDKTNAALVSGIADGTPLNLQLPSYILYENDTLHVEVKSAEQCISKDRAVVPVDVIIPPVPVAKDTFYCVNAAALQLSATAAPGYSIQWHDLNGAPVSAAPVPPTTVADTLIYNITQKHNLLGCESDTIQATIIIIALPDPVVAVSQDICPGQYPKIEIEETLPGYIYKVYSESGTLLETRQGTGDSIIIAIPETIDKPTIYFVETINTYGCASKDKSQVETYVKVNIDDLPDMNINATASGICRETSPVIIVGKTKDLFTYILFDKDDNILLSAVADGTPLSLNPDLVLSGNDTLYIEIRDKQGCPSVGKVVVPVDVVIPPVPVTTDTSYCVNDISSQLVATADEGYYIQWYDLYDAPLNTAPAPSTAEAGTFVYKITQRHETLYCESDPVKANVRVEALPAAVDAIAQDICPGQFPKIEIRETLAGYVYNVYSAQGTLLMTRQSDGDSIMFFVPESLTESEIYLVETVNTSGCISGDRTTVEAKVVNYAYINPDAIPKYERGKQYSFQLETNAVYPYEFTADGLMYGFAINATGLISGIPTVNGLLDSIPFMVRVMDINGCFATKDYILKSELFVPQVITPNGDGKNDVFMKGRKLVIFDRLGLEIYEGADGWDGKKTDGSIVAPDTYFYTIFRENGSNEVEKRGYITLIRK
jgi:gliding motility-associated-like protein